jgi:glycosyltransferase involved in cell wall biosynthesis
MPDEVTSQALRYSVVVPVYNEAENIGKLCRAVKEQLPPGYDC